MPKIRGVKPDTWTDDKFVQLSPLARLLFIGMWNYACDNGHVEDNAVQLKLRLLPMDNCDIPSLVAELINTGQVARHDGYLKVLKLPEHQKIDKFWLTLCEWCEQDPDTTFTEVDKKARKASSSRATVGDKSGNSLAPDAEVRGSEVRGSEVKGDDNTDTSDKLTKLPTDWQPTPEHKKRATETGLDLDTQAAKFRLHVEEKGRKAANWNSAFTRWLMNAHEWSKPKSRPAAPVHPHVSTFQPAPSGMTDEEYDAWEAAQRRGA